MSSFELKPKYGKQSVPVFKVQKKSSCHEIVDMMVKILLEGNERVDKSWFTGDNSGILPTETQKNTCYAVALKAEFTSIEDYGQTLGLDILERHDHISKVYIEIDGKEWNRVEIDGIPHNHVFAAAREPVKRKCVLVITRSSASVTSGIFDMKLMKTTQSGFAGFIQDKYTDLKPVGPDSDNPDRIMCTELDASWTFSSPPWGDFNRVNASIINTLLKDWSGPPDTGIYSKSVQQTAYKMATSVLSQFLCVREVLLITPNIHHYTYPLQNFSLKNNNVVFMPTNCHENASGLIETRVVRNKRLPSRL
jgi:urate oxidase